VDFILDHLAVGSYQEALTPPSGITALLNVAEEHDLTEASLLYGKVPVVDMKSIPAPLLKDAVTWIASHIDDQKIMVFCHGGVGRSPSVIIAYLCCKRGFGFGEAVEYVATRKPRMSILPNLILRIAEVKELLEKENAGAASA
jgi:protein-tyrosine phosphatase